jgi:transposase-like protein
MSSSTLDDVVECVFKRVSYELYFKIEVANEARRTGNITLASKKYGVPYDTVRYWFKQHKKNKLDVPEKQRGPKGIVSKLSPLCKEAIQARMLALSRRFTFLFLNFCAFALFVFWFVPTSL